MSNQVKNLLVIYTDMYKEIKNDHDEVVALRMALSDELYDRGYSDVEIRKILKKYK